MRGVGIGASGYIAGLGLILIPFITYLVRNVAIVDCQYKPFFQVRAVFFVTLFFSCVAIVYFAFIMFQGRENLVLPLVIMGTISVVGGVTALRLPETLHHSLPQTVEEGEEFGKDWSMADCIQCIPKR